MRDTIGLGHSMIAELYGVTKLRIDYKFGKIRSKWLFATLGPIYGVNTYRSRSTKKESGAK